MPDSSSSASPSPPAPKSLAFSISSILSSAAPKPRLPFHLQFLLGTDKAEAEAEEASGSEDESEPWPSEAGRLWPHRLALTNRRIGHPYQTRAPARHKKPRTSFKKDQVTELEKRFLDQKYLASTERAALAKSLHMSDAQVKTWFQNRRTKWRRQAAEEKEQERQVACRLLQTSPYLAAHYAPQPTYFARPDVAI